jgi:hypothetical protein
VLFHKLLELKSKGFETSLKGNIETLNFQDLEMEYSAFLENKNKKERVKYTKIAFLAIIGT